jgi:hypothetical protein
VQAYSGYTRTLTLYAEAFLENRKVTSKFQQILRLSGKMNFVNTFSTGPPPFNSEAAKELLLVGCPRHIPHVHSYCPLLHPQTETVVCLGLT